MGSLVRLFPPIGCSHGSVFPAGLSVTRREPLPDASRREPKRRVGMSTRTVRAVTVKAVRGHRQALSGSGRNRLT